MDIEKLIEQLNGYFEGKDLKRGVALDAATALSTLQAENEKLRAESIMHHNAADNYWYELNEYRQERNEALAELEQVKAEKAKAIEALSENLRAAYQSRDAAVDDLERLRELVEVRHGRWNVVEALSDDIQTAGKCNICWENIRWVGKIPNYCPNCGARMDGVSDG